MAFDNSFVAVTAATYTASQYNTYTRGNFSALWVYTTAGDIAYATSATTLARLGKPAGVGLFKNDATGVPSWLTGGNALDGLRKNAANNDYEWASLGIKYCAVNNSSDFTQSSGVVAWNTDLLDPHGWHSTSSNTSRITPTETGIYICGGMFRHYEGGGGTPVSGNYIGFRLNGTLLNNTRHDFNYTKDSLSKSYHVVSRPISITAGGYLEMEMYLDASKTAIADYSCFWVVKIA